MSERLVSIAIFPTRTSHACTKPCGRICFEPQDRTGCSLQETPDYQPTAEGSCPAPAGTLVGKEHGLLACLGGNTPEEMRVFEPSIGNETN